MKTVLLLLFSVLTGCSSETAKKSIKHFDSRISKNAITKQQEERTTPPDTFLIKTSDKCTILGFTLSQIEYDNLSEADQAEYDEIYSDFITDFNHYNKTTGSKKYHLVISASNVFSIAGNNTIAKSKINTAYVGFIFIDRSGKSKVINGSLSPDELTHVTNEFFEK